MATKKVTFNPFMENLIRQLETAQRFGTARNYQRAWQSFRKFLRGKDIGFNAFDGELMAAYENWLTMGGVSRNSSSFYLRILRSVYNKAVRRRLVKPGNPFAEVYTGIDRTQKRAVGEEVLQQMLKMNLDASPALALARDLFVFSFCTRGMAFVDVAFLKKSDVVGGYICYVRRKTGQRLAVRVEACVENIMQRYEKRTADSVYVFPVLTATEPVAAYRQYRTALTYHNRKLKRIGRELGVSLNLTSYTARHTWATTARKRNIPISVISESMGHTNEKTTQIYLASIESTVIDRANGEVVKHLNLLLSTKQTFVRSAKP